MAKKEETSCLNAVDYIHSVTNNNPNWTEDWSRDLFSLFTEITKAAYEHRNERHTFFWLDSFEITCNKMNRVIGAQFLKTEKGPDSILSKWFKTFSADSDDETKWVYNIGMILIELLLPQTSKTALTTDNPEDVPRLENMGVVNPQLVKLIEKICPYYCGKDKIGFKELGELIWDILRQKEVNVQLHYVLRDDDSEITRSLYCLAQYEPEAGFLTFFCRQGADIVDDNGKICYAVRDTALDFSETPIKIDVYGDEINIVDALSVSYLRGDGATGNTVAVCILSKSSVRVVVYKRDDYFKRECSSQYILRAISRNGCIELSKDEGNGLTIEIDKSGTVSAGSHGRVNSVDLCNYAVCCFTTALSEYAERDAVRDFIIILKDGFSRWKGKVEKAFETVFACYQGIEKMIISDTLLTYLVCKDYSADYSEKDSAILIDCDTEGRPYSIIRKEPTRYAVEHGVMDQQDSRVFSPDDFNRIIVKSPMDQDCLIPEIRDVFKCPRNKELYWIDSKIDPADCGLSLYLQREKIFLDGSFIGTLIRDYFGRTFLYPFFQTKRGESWKCKKITLVPQGAERLGFYIFNDPERIRNMKNMWENPVLAFDVKEESIKKIGSISLNEAIQEIELEVSFSGSTLKVKYGDNQEAIYLDVDWKDSKL